MGIVALTILCSVLMLIGLLGVVLPGLPGVPLCWLGLFIYALGTGFERIPILTVVVFFVLMLLTLVLDFVAPMLGARKYRASKFGIFGAFLHSANELTTFCQPLNPVTLTTRIDTVSRPRRSNG